jgi:hypothetical protein
MEERERVCDVRVDGGGQCHTCTWRLLEAATVWEVWRATATELEREGERWDGARQETAAASTASPLAAA